MTPKQRRQYSNGLALTVFLLGLGLAAAAALWTKNIIYSEAEVRFKHLAERLVADLTERFKKPVYGLNGARGVYAASEKVSTAEFRAYVESRDLPVEFPGVRGFGLIQHVMRAELDAFVATQQVDVAADFAIRPFEDQNLPELYVVSMIEPALNNPGALGLDIGSEKVRRAALQRAIDTGRPAFTGAITLVQDHHKTPGLLVYVPVYVNGTNTTNLEQRRAALVGVLYAPIVIWELLDGMPEVGGESGVDFELFDAPLKQSGGLLLYDADNHHAQLKSVHSLQKRRMFSVQQSFMLPGREMTLRVSSTPEFDAAIEKATPWLVFAVMTLISTLLALLVRQQASGRRRAEALAQEMTAQIQQDQARTQDFSRSASDWFWETDAEHRFCFFSENFEAIYGLPADQLLGKSRKTLLTENDVERAEQWPQHLRQLDAHMPFRNFEYRMRISAIDTRWVSISGVPHFDAEGEFVGYRGTGTLITARKRHEAESAELNRKLSELNQRFSLAADAARIGVWDYDILQNQLVWDKWMYALYGVHEADFPGAYQAWIQGLHPDDRARGDEEIAMAIRGEKAFETRFRVIWPNGEVRHIEAAALVQRNAEGESIRMIGVNYDITEQVRQQVELSEQRRRLANIIEATHVGTWEWAIQTGKVVFNERWAQILGYTLDELAPHTIETWTRLCHPDDLKRSEALLEQHFAGALLYYEFEGRVRHKNGDWMWVLDRGQVVNRAPDGTPRLMSGTHQDISARKANELMLIEAREQAEAANVAKSRFLATMSHEIRTPMNGILGMAQILLTPDLGTDARQDYARTIFTSGQTLLTLLNDILDLSKVEAGKLELELIAFEPGQILHESQSLFAETAYSKGLKIESDRHDLIAGSRPQRYLGDAYRLRQMVTNLVSNAIKFTDQGVVRIEAQEVVDGGDEHRAVLEFSVTDSGVGVSEDQQALLFQAFSQADSSTTRQFGGSGLGLSIVRSLAQLMGGEVGVSSAPGQGARFWFRVQVDRLEAGVDSREALRIPEQPSLDSAVTSGQANAVPKKMSGRVLLVEDNPTNRKVMQVVLNSLGIRYVIAENGQEAVNAITDGAQVDLILMDVQMPVMDGYTATAWIRDREAELALPHLPIIALTADAFEEDRQRCLAAGMDDFLTKPVNVVKLSAALERWLPGEQADQLAEPVVGALESAAVYKNTAVFTEPQEPRIAAPTSDLPIFDEKTLLMQLGDDRELCAEVLPSAANDIVNYFDQLDQAIADDNLKDALRLLHSLKGLAAQIGGIRLANEFKTAEVRLKSGHFPELADMTALRIEYQAFLDELPAWLRSSLV